MDSIDGQTEENARHPGGMRGHLSPVCAGSAVDFARRRPVASSAEQRLGRCNSVFKRSTSWSRFDVWENMLAHISAKAELENVCIDSTVVRAHACAAGAASSHAAAKALGRSRGGFGCKIDALTDALGLPVRFILTAGQAADITQAIPLVKDIGSTGALLAGKGYDANALFDWLGQRGIAVSRP